MDEKIKKVFFSIAINWLGAAITAIVSFVIGVVFWKTDTETYVKVIVYLILTIITLIAFIISLSKRSTNSIWTYKFKKEEAVFTLEENNKAFWKDEMQLCDIKKSQFDSRVKGSIDWTGVNLIEKFTCKCDHTGISFYEGKSKLNSQDNSLTIEKPPKEIDYEITLNHRWDVTNRITLSANLDLDSDEFDRQLFCEVVRPTKELVLILRVNENVNICNIKCCMLNFHGDQKSIKTFEENRQYEVAGKKEPRRVDGIPGYIDYEYIIKKPRILKRYLICWDKGV